MGDPIGSVGRGQGSPKGSITFPLNIGNVRILLFFPFFFFFWRGGGGGIGKYRKAKKYFQRAITASSSTSKL